MEITIITTESHCPQHYEPTKNIFWFSFGLTSGEKKKHQKVFPEPPTTLAPAKPQKSHLVSSDPPRQTSALDPQKPIKNTQKETNIPNSTETNFITQKPSQCQAQKQPNIILPLEFPNIEVDGHAQQGSHLDGEWPVVQEIYGDGLVSFKEV